jgi:D-xylose transport system permease protein
MATQLPVSSRQGAPPEEPEGVRALARDALSGIGARLRQGELGVMPVVLSLIAVWIFFQAMDSHFLTARNISNLVLQISVIGTIATGVVLVLLLGEIDLSVGSVAGLCSAVLGSLLVLHGWPWWAAVLAMLATGAAVGAFQGAWFAIIGVPSFVVTLAGNLGWLGLQLRVLGENGTINVFDENIARIATSFLPRYWGWVLAIGISGAFAASRLVRETRRRRAGLPSTSTVAVAVEAIGLIALACLAVAVLNSAQGVPTAGVILLGVVLFFSWVTTRTGFGRYIYAVGGNAEAARRAGINVTRVRVIVFTLGSSMAALGGLIAVSRGAAASTQTGGGTLLLESIAAAVIGGTSLFGGRGSVWSALFGALVIGSVSNGLDLIGQSAEVKYIVSGAILLLAITIDALSRRTREAAGR